MTTTQRQVIYVLWILVVPSAFYVAYQFYPSNDFDYVNLAINTLILIAIMNLSIPLENVSIALERWVVFTVFFQYGIVAEMVFMQIAMLVLLVTLKSSTPKPLRFAFNSINFVIISLVSALIYYAVGGSLEYMTFGTFVIAGFIYASFYSIVNGVLLIVLFKAFKQETTNMKKAIAWDYLTTILLLPFAIANCYLLQQFGNKSFLLVGVPFILVMFVIRNYMKSHQLHNVLASSTKIGHQLADCLRVEDVLLSFTNNIKGVIPYESVYIVDLQGEEKLNLLTFIEGEFRKDEADRFSFPHKKSEHDGLDSKSTKKYLTKKSLDSLRGYTFAPSVESVMTAPIKNNGKTEGFLVLTSTQKYAYDETQLKMVDLLTGYFAVAVEKARFYERTVEKSVKCGLTGLYNFRHLEAKIDEEIVRYHTGAISMLSTIMIDIDHFKAINDTYGHQSGNDLLCAFASQLKDYQMDGMTLARYGGEEFVMILPECTKEEAVELAHIIRKKVEETIYNVIPDLSKEREPTVVHMTCSIGVATIPIDASDGKELLRNADRALYIGGKQAGRNRVGVYGENSNVNVVS